MSRRITLSQLLIEGARYQYRRLAVDMGGMARTVNLKTGKPAIFHDISPRFLYGQTVKAEAILKGHFSYAGQNLDVGTQGDPNLQTNLSRDNTLKGGGGFGNGRCTPEGKIR